MSNEAEQECTETVAALVQIPLARIDRGRERFAFAFPRGPDATLIDSIKEMGLLVPVAVQTLRAGEYRIVCGHRRIAAAQAAGLREVAAGRLDAKLPDQTLFLLNLHENTALRPVNDMERALALHRLVSDFAAGERVVSAAMARLGLEPSRKILERYLRLVRLSPALQRYVVSHGIPLRVSARLADLSLEDQSVLCELLRTVPLGGNALREMLDLAEEIALRDGIELRTVLLEGSLQAVIEDSCRTVRQKREGIKQCLCERRYPLLRARQAEIHTLLKTGVATSELSCTAPPYLEGRELQMTFSFQSVAELREKLAHLEGVARREELARALALLSVEDEE